MLTKTEVKTLSDALVDKVVIQLASRLERPIRLIKTNTVLDRACISNSQLFRLLQEGKFPLPKICSPAGRAWLESDISDYLTNLEEDDWHLYLERQEKKAAAGRAGMAKKKAAAGEGGNE